MTTQGSLSAKARELLSSIADDIEAGGHWQNGSGREFRVGNCRINTSPSWQEAAFRSGSVLNELVDYFGGLSRIWEFNDTHPTEEVLATLRSIARGEL